MFLYGLCAVHIDRCSLCLHADRCSLCRSCWWMFFVPFVSMDVLCAIRTDWCSLCRSYWRVFFVPFVLTDVFCAVRTDGCSLCRSYWWMFFVPFVTDGCSLCRSGSEGSTCYSISSIQQFECEYGCCGPELDEYCCFALSEETWVMPVFVSVSVCAK